MTFRQHHAVPIAAAKTGFSQSTAYRIEQRRRPSATTLSAICAPRRQSSPCGLLCDYRGSALDTIEWRATNKVGVKRQSGWDRL